jgi:Nif-specific regulatory protein
MAKACSKTGGECYGALELDLLAEISMRMMKSGNISDELSQILKITCEYLNGTTAFISLTDIDGQNIHIEAAYGLTPNQQNRGKYKVGEGIIGRVVETGLPVYIPQISRSRLFLNRTGIPLQKNGEEFSYTCVPIRVENQVIGTLSIVRPFNDHIEREEEMRMLSIIGGLMIEGVRVMHARSHEIEQLKAENRLLQDKLVPAKRPSNIIGNSGKMQDVFNLLNMVAPTNTTVLIRGESGCGKELIADAIHFGSLRFDKPFVKVNCSALPENLIESELFGHEKGAFTGAESQHLGKFEQATGGTIFLDEIGDLPLPVQVKLLRVLQQKEFQRVGGTRTIQVDVRVVCATNRNLEQLMEEQKFRDDLFYRINVFPLFLPPLRERRNDIPALADHFIEKFNKQNKASIKRITTSALDMLMVYSWPGNIRELENVIERACILSTENVIRSYSLPPSLQTAQTSGTSVKGGMSYLVEKLEKQLIIDSLTSNSGNATKAASELKITERILGLRMKKYNIDLWRYKI